MKVMQIHKEDPETDDVKRSRNGTCLSSSQIAGGPTKSRGWDRQNPKSIPGLGSGGSIKLDMLVHLFPLLLLLRCMLLERFGGAAINFGTSIRSPCAVRGLAVAGLLGNSDSVGDFTRRRVEKDPGVGVTSRKYSKVGVGVDSRSGDASGAGVGGRGHSISEKPGGMGDGGGSAAPKVYPVKLIGSIGLSHECLETPESGDNVKFAGGFGGACIGGGPGVGGRTRVFSVNEDDRGSSRIVSRI